MKLFNKLKKLSWAKFLSLNKKRQTLFKNTLLFIAKKPFTSFFAVLAIFFVLMLVGNILFAPRIAPEKNLNVAKKVQVYKIGSSPQITFQGKVEKSGVIKIVSQTSGIVSAINVSEGQQVFAGTNILSLATNYSGGNAASISREISQTQYQNVKDTFDIQKQVLANQRETANKNKDNSEIMKQITTQSAIDTKALADLDSTIVNGIESNIQSLEAANVNGSNNTAILQAKESLAQFQAALSQTNSSFKSIQIQANSASNDVSNLQYQIALKQLDIQEKTLNMNLDIARLSYNLASVYEQNMFPSSPFSGTVDKIFVHIGDNVGQGTTLASLSGDSQHVEIVVMAPGDVAKNISIIEPSVLYIGDKTISMTPSFISKDATSGVLYSVIYQLDDSLTPELTDATYVNVKIPVGVAKSTNIDPFIPLDSVIQTQEENFVYVVQNQKAKVKKILLGQIQGRYVEVLSGLPSESEVIMDRSVVEGDKIEVIR